MTKLRTFKVKKNMTFNVLLLYGGTFSTPNYFVRENNHFSPELCTSLLQRSMTQNKIKIISRCVRSLKV